MAVVNDNITYYNKNVLRSLDNWNILSNASVSGNYINIGSGGTAGVDLSNDYYNGLKACKYRGITVGIKANINNQNNYQNYIEVVLKCIYKDNEGNKLVAYMSVNATLLNNIYSDGLLVFSRVINMENYDLDSATLMVINHTAYDIQLQTCIMKRSQDVNSSQIGESIGWGITLNQVIAYLDGCEIFYDGVETPDKLWWMEDKDGNFNGINVNNERMIKFSRKNEILLD